MSLKLLKRLVIYIGLLQVVGFLVDIHIRINDSEFMYMNNWWMNHFITIALMVIIYEATYRKRYGRDKKRTLLAFAMGFILGFFSSRLYDRWRGWRI